MWPDDKKKFFTEDARPSFDEQAKALKKMFENLEDIKKVIVDYVKEKEWGRKIKKPLNLERARLS